MQGNQGIFQLLNDQYRSQLAHSLKTSRRGIVPYCLRYLIIVLQKTWAIKWGAKWRDWNINFARIFREGILRQGTIFWRTFESIGSLVFHCHSSIAATSLTSPLPLNWLCFTVWNVVVTWSTGIFGFESVDWETRVQSPVRDYPKSLKLEFTSTQLITQQIWDRLGAVKFNTICIALQISS